MTNPTKKVLNALEKVFAAEIDGHLFQSKAKIYQDLCEQGLLLPDERKVGTGALAVTVRGYGLSHQGRFVYCMSC